MLITCGKLYVSVHHYRHHIYTSTSSSLLSFLRLSLGTFNSFGHQVLRAFQPGDFKQARHGHRFYTTKILTFSLKPFIDLIALVGGKEQNDARGVKFEADTVISYDTERKNTLEWGAQWLGVKL